MIKKGIILVISLVVLGLSACNQNVKDNHHAHEKPNSNKDSTDHLENHQYGNEAFKEVMLTRSKDEIVVTGKARVFEGVFQYAIVSPNEMLKQETYQTVGAPAWGSFTFPIDMDLVANKGVMLELFVYSAKDGSKINTLEIPLNRINK